MLPIKSGKKTGNFVHIHCISIRHKHHNMHVCCAKLRFCITSVGYHHHVNDAVQKALFYGAKQFTKAVPSKNHRDFIRL